MKKTSESIKNGKDRRKIFSRKDLGTWEVQTGRALVEELISRQDASRVKQLIPVRHQRMAVSPFTFFRGSAIIQAGDIASSGGTDIRVQACGDAHISNFGLYASTERRVVFDINDFDETLNAPFDVDIKRLVASIEICGRERGFSKKARQDAVYDAAAMYRSSMLEFSEMGNMEVWYRHLDLESLLDKGSELMTEDNEKTIRTAVNKAMSNNSMRAIEKMTETVDGKLRIKSNPPLIVPIREMPDKEKELYDLQCNLYKAFDIYRQSLPPEKRILIDQYEPIELAHKVVGVGSVGRRAWVMVLMGRDDGDPLVLQIKQAERSVLEDYYGKSEYETCGQRVVEGQRLIQTAGDILLGWFRLELPGEKTFDYYVRQLYDSKGSFNLEKITQNGYHGLASMCAWTLAHAHAKTGNRHELAGYLGKGEAFEEAMVKYADSYADQNEADYDMFLKFCKNADNHDLV